MLQRAVLFPLFLLLLLVLPVVCTAEEPLPPEQAFRFQASLQDDHTVQIRFDIAPGYYLYRDKLQFALDGATPGAPIFPAGEVHEDRFFGKQTIFHNTLNFSLPVQQGVPTQLHVTAQGCSERLGICYPPIDFFTSLKAISMAGNPQQGGNALPPLLQDKQASAQMDRPGADAPQSGAQAVCDTDGDDTTLAKLLTAGKLLPLVASFFGFGLLLAFTPCVLPMVPILSSIIVGQGETLNRRRALALSCAYVGGMAVTYTVAGILAGFTGAALSGMLQNVWVLAAFALVFVLLALPMFGFFELQIPSALQSRLNAIANRHGGSISGLAFMGAISALIVGPCMTAPLAAALLAIAQSGSAIFGGVALFSLALGMGTPLVLVGVLAHHWLPKPGPWMEAVKWFFGWLLIATAWWLLWPVLPRIIGGWLLAALLAAPAIKLWRARELGERPRQFAQTAATLLGIAAIWVALACLPSMKQTDPVSALPFETVHSNSELDARIAASDKPVIVDFYADWCVSCREMERDTFRDPDVQAQLAQFTRLRVDVTNNTAEDKALLKRFGLYAPPAMLFFDASGQELCSRLVGYMDAEHFGARLTRALGENSN